MTSLKDIQVQSSCFCSCSLFSLALPCNRIVGRTRIASVCVVNAEKQTAFNEAEQLKNMHAPCVDVTLHLVRISAGELQHSPSMQPSYIHNSRSHPLSISLSLSYTIHCTNPPSFKLHPLSWPFPCSHTQAYKLCTVSLK